MANTKKSLVPKEYNLGKQVEFKGVETKNSPKSAFKAKGRGKKSGCNCKKGGLGGSRVKDVSSKHHTLVSIINAPEETLL